jgi:hypothetical protein
VASPARRVSFALHNLHNVRPPSPPPFLPISIAIERDIKKREKVEEKTLKRARDRQARAQEKKVKTQELDEDDIFDDDAHEGQHEEDAFQGGQMSVVVVARM